MWGATRFRAGKSRFIIPDGSYNAARSDRTQLLVIFSPVSHIYAPRYTGQRALPDLKIARSGVKVVVTSLLVD